MNCFICLEWVNLNGAYIKQEQEDSGTQIITILLRGYDPRGHWWQFDKHTGQLLLPTFGKIWWHSLCLTMTGLLTERTPDAVCIGFETCMYSIEMCQQLLYCLEQNSISVECFVNSLLDTDRN